MENRASLDGRTSKPFFLLASPVPRDPGSNGIPLHCLCFYSRKSVARQGACGNDPAMSLCSSESWLQSGGKSPNEQAIESRLTELLGI
jgi:hypothetical protein